MNATIKVGILDDHPAILSAIKSELESNGCDIVFAARSSDELFSALKLHQPDVLIVDIVVPSVTGIEVFELLNKDYSETKVIAFSSLGSPILIENLLEVGVKGYLNKNQELSELNIVIETILGDGNAIYLPDEYRFLMKRFREREKRILSKREIEILEMIAVEMTSNEIAEKLFISLNTVENHRKNILKKLKVKNLAGMILEASRQGYIS